MKTCQTVETSHSQSTQEPALRIQLAHTLLVMRPMAVHFCPWSNDVSEACGLLQECKVIKEEYEFREEKSSFVPTCSKKRDQACLLFLQGYIFTIGWEFEYLLIMDTHAIFQELSGKGNRLVKIFLQDDRQLAAEDLCVCLWVWK